MIRFAQVYKKYENGHEALKGVSFFLDRQEMAFLIGRSGAGKSTLLKLITRVETATRGQLIINDKNITRIARRRIPAMRREIGVVSDCSGVSSTVVWAFKMKISTPSPTCIRIPGTAAT